MYHSVNYDIILISETWLSDKDKVRLKGFDIVRKDRLNNKGGGVAIFIRNGLKYMSKDIKYQCDNKLEVCAIDLFTNKGIISFVSCYRPPQSNIKAKEWEKFFDQFSNRSAFVGGDFNAHNSLWGDLTNCSNGFHLELALLETDLLVLNNGVPTYINPALNKESVLDLSMISTNLGLISRWEVLQDTWGSDHFPVHTSINVKADSIPKPKKIKRLYSCRTDWTRFESSVEAKLPALQDLFDHNKDLQVIYSSFVDIITDSLDNEPRTLSRSSSSPTSTSVSSVSSLSRPSKHLPSPSRSLPSCPWWDSECDALINSRREALRKFKSSRSSQDFIEYSKCNNLARCGIRKIKKEKFKLFCESLTRFSNPSYVWGKIKAFKNRFNTRDLDHQYNENDEKTILDLIHNLFPPWAPLLEFSIPLSTGDPFLDLPFSELEFSTVIESLRIKASPGLDRIDYLIVKKLPNSAKTFLLNLFNSMFEHKFYPREWNNFLVFFIPKVDRNKFRPISLASCLCKIFERLVYNRLVWWLEYHDILPSSQFGFRNNRSCMDNLSILHAENISAVENHESSGIVFLDIVGAFDNVLCDILLQKLLQIGLSSNVLSFIANITYKRQVYCRYGSIDEVFLAYKGLPQGCVLSPVLYALYVADLDRQVLPPVKILQYADDVALLCRDKDVVSCLDHLETCTNSLKHSLDLIGLELSPTKTKLCFFGDHKLTPEENSVSITINGHQIFNVKIAKFLGITFQSNLKWDSHINALSKSCFNPLNIINCLRHTWWGADIVTLLNLYKSLIRSRLDYGSILFDNLTKHQISKLDRIQFRAIRLALGYRASTPTNILLAEANEPPLFLRRQYLAKKYIIKFLLNPNHPILPTLQNLESLFDNPLRICRSSPPLLLKTFTEVYPLSRFLLSFRSSYVFSKDYVSSFFTPSIDIESGFSLQDKPFTNSLFHSMFYNDFHFSKCLFTDGSKNNESEFGGFSFTTEDGSLSHLGRSSNIASVFSLEAFAISRALEEIYDNNWTQATIFSDSRSVLSALQHNFNRKSSSHIILSLKDKIRFLYNNGFAIKFIWIPGHCQISGNELADSKARSAIMNGRDTHLKIPISDFYLFFKNSLRSHFRKWCIEIGLLKGTRYFNSFFQPRRHPWFYNLHIPRRTIVSINRLRSGHSSLRDSLFKFKIVNDPMCPICAQIEDANHILWQCQRFETQRSTLIKKISNIYNTLPLPVDLLLADLSCDTINALNHFFLNIEFFI